MWWLNLDLGVQNNVSGEVIIEENVVVEPVEVVDLGVQNNDSGEVIVEVNVAVESSVDVNVGVQDDFDVEWGNAFLNELARLESLSQASEFNFTGSHSQPADVVSQESDNVPGVLPSYTAQKKLTVRRMGPNVAFKKCNPNVAHSTANVAEKSHGKACTTNVNGPRVCNPSASGANKETGKNCIVNGPQALKNPFQPPKVNMKRKAIYDQCVPVGPSITEQLQNNGMLKKTTNVKVVKMGNTNILVTVGKAKVTEK